MQAWPTKPHTALDLGPVQMHARARARAHKCTSAYKHVHANECAHTWGIAQKRWYGLEEHLLAPASTKP